METVPTHWEYRLSEPSPFVRYALTVGNVGSFWEEVFTDDAAELPFLLLALEARYAFDTEVCRFGLCGVDRRGLLTELGHFHKRRNGLRFTSSASEDRLHRSGSYRFGRWLYWRLFFRLYRPLLRLVNPNHPEVREDDDLVSED